MNLKSTQNENKTSLIDDRARVMRRSWKHYAVSAAIVSAAAFGLAESRKDIKESDHIGLGAILLTITGLGSIVGAGVMLPRHYRDQRSLARIDRAIEAGETRVRLMRSESIYQKNADGRYETIGQGQQRVQTKMRLEFAAAAGLAATGTVLLLDTMFANRLALTETILPLVGNMHGAQSLAAFAEAFTGVASLGGAIRLGVAGNDSSKISAQMESDKQAYGENARRYKLDANSLQSLNRT